MVVVALLVDLGRPERIWYLIIYWNLHSVMFEVGWCVMLYTAVLALEFSPLTLRAAADGPAPPDPRHYHPAGDPGHDALHAPPVLAGLAVRHLPEKLHQLWYTPLLPVFFFLTAVAVGPAMVILESTISSRVFKRGLEVELLGKLALAIPVALGAYLV